MIYRRRGIGKTWIGLADTCAVASGRSFLAWDVPNAAGGITLRIGKQKNVLFVWSLVTQRMSGFDAVDGSPPTASQWADPR